MNVHESDGIPEVLEDALRLAVSAAARVAEARVRQREQQLRDAQAQSEHATRELRSRLNAERAAARAERAPTSREEWWDRAEPADIQRAWETARTWKDQDPDVAQAAQRIRSELQDRYAINIDGLAETEPRGESRRRDRAQQHEAATLIAGADRAEQDTAQRREVFTE
jgi:hypothetical protein